MEITKMKGNFTLTIWNQKTNQHTSVEHAMGRLRLENFPRSDSSSIFCLDLLRASNNAHFKFQVSGSYTLEVMSICLNHIKLKKFQENF